MSSDKTMYHFAFSFFFKSDLAVSCQGNSHKKVTKIMMIRHENKLSKPARGRVAGVDIHNTVGMQCC